jgi:hypothetical protein
LSFHPSNPETERPPAPSVPISGRTNGTDAFPSTSGARALNSGAIIATGDGANDTTTSEPILGEWAAQWFEERGIDPELATRLGIYTARNVAPKGGPSQMVPDANGRVLVFPYRERSVVVSEKYRAPGKQFWQREGGKRTFYNADVLDEPALQDGRAPLIITEGEPDCLAAMTCGFPFTVSVPDGAPAVPKDKQPGELEPLDETQDAQGKFEFLWSNRARLKRVKRYVIAVDNDGPGFRLAAELVRRLGAGKCSFVTYPEGCKDLNDVLMRHGRERVKAVLDGAQRYPVRGLYDLDDYPAKGDLETFHTGSRARGKKQSISDTNNLDRTALSLSAVIRTLMARAYCLLWWSSAFDRDRTADVLLAEADHHRALDAGERDHVVELVHDPFYAQPVGDIARLRVDDIDRASRLDLLSCEPIL